MSLRFRDDPKSSVPVAVGCLRGYRWVICERGYANVVRCSNPNLRRGDSRSGEGLGEDGSDLKVNNGAENGEEVRNRKMDAINGGDGGASGQASEERDGTERNHKGDAEPHDDTDNVVWGIIYNMSLADEAQLDLYEGHDEYRNPEPKINPNIEERVWKPYLQGGWDYNKHYVPVRVVKWLRERGEYGMTVSNGTETRTGLGLDDPVIDGPPDEFEPADIITSLVYVDEHRTAPGTINAEYIGRMNRGIKESVALGVPEEWVERVMRRWVVRDVEVDDEGYVGTDRGYVAAEATETLEDVRGRVLRDGNGGGGGVKEERGGYRDGGEWSKGAW